MITSALPSVPEAKEEILENCHEVLPDYMIPKEIEIRDTLPRTECGKIDYRALEKENIMNYH